jgi:hypothetical protein
MAIWQRRRGKSNATDRAQNRDEPLSDAAPITVTATTWQEQFQELWDQLVPRGGAAETEQGEVIRIAGKVSREILDIGSINWNPDFRAMVDEITTYLSGTAAVGRRGELESLRTAVRDGGGSKVQLYRLTELAVTWVLANPHPVPLGHTPYRN